MENHEKRKSFNWSMVVALLALIIGAAALALSWQMRIDNQKQLAALSVLQLRDAVLSSRSYQLELSSLREVLAKSPKLKGTLDELAKRELSGLPSMEALDKEFQEASAAALVAEQSRPSLGILNSVTSRIAATAVSIGMDSGSNPFESVLTPAIHTAEGLLEAGQLSESIAAIDGIPSEFASNFDSWKASTESRIAVEEALDALVREFVPPAPPAQ